MGLDGGTVVTRSDVLRGQSWRVAQNDTSRSTRGGNVTKVPTESVDKSVERATAWSTCALSSQPLRPPIVACGLGRLYNRDAVLQFVACRKGLVSEAEALLSYANQLRVAAGALDHITSLKDMLEVHLAPAVPEPAAAGANGASGSNGSTGGGSSSGGFVCPITQLPCDRHPCSALRPCGHVLSDRAIRNLTAAAAPSSAAAAAAAPPSADGAAAAPAGGERCCPVCGAAFVSQLPIHGSPEQVEALREGLRAAAARAEKKGAGGGGGGKKRKAADAAGSERAAADAERAAADAERAAQRQGRGPG